MKKIFIFLFVSLFSVSMFAADIIVTTVADDSDVPPSGSLREAIANAQSGDVIKFKTTDGGTIELKSTLTISGAGKVWVIDGLNATDGKPIILTKSADASASSRIFQIANGSGSENIDVTIKNFSFENIKSTSNGASITSGNSAYQTAAAPPIKIVIESCQFKNSESSISSTSSSGGGGVYFASHGTNVTFKNCLFQNNKLTFSDKETEDASKSIGGGCISTTGNNTAKITAINSTFANNSSLARGGAIFSGHPLYLVNCTFVGNHGMRGGGVYFHNDNEIIVVNTILTHNTSTDNPDRGDLYRNPGTPTKNNQFGYMIVGLTNYTMEGMPMVDLFPTDLPPLYASLDTYNNPALGDNGGLFETVALSSNSAARNKGTTGTFQGLQIPTDDQRGYTRSATPSIGAFEFGAAASTNNIKSAENKIYSVADQIIFADGMKGYARVFNVSGACVFQSEAEGTLRTNLPAGVYLVRFDDYNSNSAMAAKIVIK